MRATKLIGVATLALLAFPALLEAEVPPVPATPAAVDDLVYARPFKLEEGYAFEWRKERPLVKEGYIVVLKVDPDLVYARQTAEPVLYVGDQTAERVNLGHKSGHVVAIVPGNVEKMDLGKTLIWFGTPALPERCTAKTIEEEKAKAEKAKIKPLKQTVIDAAKKRGGKRLEVADRYELRRELATLIKEYAPDETELAEGLLVPRTERNRQDARSRP